MTYLVKKFCSSFIVTAFKRGKSTLKSSEINMKVFTQKRNPLTGSTEWDMQDENYDYHQEIARSAFADMLHDTERNKKYQRALQLAIEKMHEAGKKANVLDIGTGTGLLSIMAAKCGADTITACEAFKPMAECCVKILQKNGVADRITVIPKRSTDITVGEDGDMKEKANILVTEVFDTELIGEGALSTFAHAHKYLLEEDCIVVPDSAIIYAQVVECPDLQKWNKVSDFDDYGLKTPQKMKSCPGSAAVHDIQLSQIPRSSFKELSDQIPVFYYDWTGKSPLLMNRKVQQQFNVAATGTAQMVFMWWDLNMDPEGKISLSCAPWWCHYEADLSSEHPENTIPWRDHWMQAVYYLPHEKHIKKDTDATLIAYQDEYSLWFHLENDSKDYKRPICDCGVHMALSRTHVSYLNDEKRRKVYAKKLKEDLHDKSVVLDLNGLSLLGLYAAKMAKKVFIVENMNMNLRILQDFIEENCLDNVELIPEATDEILKEITYVVSDPNFPNAILPWENLKMAYLLHSFKGKLRSDVPVLPDAFELWAMPVQFQDLQKIRIPLGKCEGIDMTLFDNLVEKSRVISDSEIEAQPLWEYPCISSGVPRKLIHIDMTQLHSTYATDGSFTLNDSAHDSVYKVNGFCVWCVWGVGSERTSGGPTGEVGVGRTVQWDPHTRQGVKILKHSHTLTGANEWSYQVACDLDKGHFNVNLDLVNK